MRLFVVGKLGEVIKKIFELEDLIKENPNNKLLVVELTAYNEVVKMWPVRDDFILHKAIVIFRVNLEKLKMAEEHIRHAHPNVPEYLLRLDNVREDLRLLNELGMHIGPSPYMEVVDAVEQFKDKHSDQGRQ